MSRYAPLPSTLCPCCVCEGVCVTQVTEMLLYFSLRTRSLVTEMLLYFSLRAGSLYSNSLCFCVCLCHSRDRESALLLFMFLQPVRSESSLLVSPSVFLIFVLSVCVV